MLCPQIKAEALRHGGQLLHKHVARVDQGRRNATRRDQNAPIVKESMLCASIWSLCLQSKKRAGRLDPL